MQGNHRGSMLYLLSMHTQTPRRNWYMQMGIYDFEWGPICMHSMCHKWSHAILPPFEPQCYNNDK